MEKLILEVRADSPWCESAPSFGVAEVDEGFLQKVRYLRAEAERLKADFISVGDLVVTFHAWNENDELESVPGDVVSTDLHQLCVSKKEFWWEGTHSGTEERFRERFRTEEVSIDGLSPYRDHNLGISAGDAEKRKKRKASAAKLKGLTPLSDEAYEENLLQHGIIR